jgi:hypothetical protein
MWLAPEIGNELKPCASILARLRNEPLRSRKGFFVFVHSIKSICAPAFYSAPTPRQSPSPIVFPRAG